MRTEGGPSAIRVSCSLNVKDMQRQNSFAFVPKSDYSERWHLENKCLFHNQQVAEAYGTERSCTKSRFTCTCAYSHCKDKYQPKIFGNMTESISYHKSGDWKYDEDAVEHSVPRKLIHDPRSYDLKWRRRLYSNSVLDKPRRKSRFASGDNVSASALQDVWKKIDSSKDSGEIVSKNYLQRAREYLANYQASYGIPRTEYSFSTLIKTMGQATGQSLLALLYVMLNIIPVAEVFLYVLRFILDKMISIRDSKDFWQMLVRGFVFLTELSSVYICLLFIYGFIILPIVRMVIGITAEILLCN